MSLAIVQRIADGNATNQVTVTLGSATTNGNYLLVLAATSGSTQALSVVSGGSWVTLLSQAETAEAGYCFAALLKIDAAQNSVTIGRASATNNMSVDLWEISTTLGNIELSDSVFNDLSGTGTTVPVGSVTAVTGDLAVAVANFHENTGTPSWTNSFVLRGNNPEGLGAPDQHFVTGSLAVGSDASYSTTCSWSPAPIANQRAGFMLVLREFASGPTITSVKGGAIAVDTDTAVAIVGTTFPDGTGSSKVEIGNNATYAAATKVQIEVNAWTSSVLINVDLHEIATLNPIDSTLTVSPQGTTVWMFITDAAGTPGNGFPFLLHDNGAPWTANLNTGVTLDVTSGNAAFRVAIALEVDANTLAAASTFKVQKNKNAAGWVDVTASSADIQTNATVDFVDGDDVPDLGLGSGAYVLNNNGAEESTGVITIGDAVPTGSRIIVELSLIGIAADVSDADSIQVRMVLGDGTPLDTYTQTPTITIQKSAGGPTAISSSDSSKLGITGLPAAVITTAFQGELTSISLLDLVQARWLLLGVDPSVGLGLSTVGILTPVVQGVDSVAIGLAVLASPGVFPISSQNLIVGVVEDVLLARTISLLDPTTIGILATESLVVSLTGITETESIGLIVSESLRATIQEQEALPFGILTDNQAIGVLSVSDTLLIGNIESVFVQVTAFGVEAIQLPVESFSTVLVTITGMTTIAVGLSEVSRASASLLRTDQLPCALVEASFLTASVVGSATLPISFSEVGTPFIQAHPQIDTIPLGLSERSAIRASFSSVVAIPITVEAVGILQILTGTVFQAVDSLSLAIGITTDLLVATILQDTFSNQLVIDNQVLGILAERESIPCGLVVLALSQILVQSVDSNSLGLVFVEALQAQVQEDDTIAIGVTRTILAQVVTSMAEAFVLGSDGQMLPVVSTSVEDLLSIGLVDASTVQVVTGTIFRSTDSLPLGLSPLAILVVQTPVLDGVISTLVEQASAYISLAPHDSCLIGLNVLGQAAAMVSHTDTLEVGLVSTVTGFQAQIQDSELLAMGISPTFTTTVSVTESIGLPLGMVPTEAVTAVIDRDLSLGVGLSTGLSSVTVTTTPTDSVPGRVLDFSTVVVSAHGLEDIRIRLVEDGDLVIQFLGLEVRVASDSVQVGLLEVVQAQILLELSTDLTLGLASVGTQLSVFTGFDDIGLRVVEADSSLVETLVRDQVHEKLRVHYGKAIPRPYTYRKRGPIVW